MTIAPPAKKLLAHIIDNILFFGIFSYKLLIGGFPLFIKWIVSDSIYIPTIIVIVSSILPILLFCFAQLYLLKDGQSIGKKILNIKVVSRDNYNNIGLGMMILRETIGKAISSFICSLGYIWILIDESNQGWHDKLVNSLVVDD
jgi:uncharacterized RDD family membrane protein YckC